MPPDHWKIQSDVRARKDTKHRKAIRTCVKVSNIPTYHRTDGLARSDRVKSSSSSCSSVSVMVTVAALVAIKVASPAEEEPAVSGIGNLATFDAGGGGGGGF